MHRQRLAGVVLPRFSIRTRRDWGIGQITDLPAAATWIREAGHTLLQVLPPYELAEGESSPYGARTAFGLDPIYVDVDAVPDLDAATVKATLGADGEATLAHARQSSEVLYSEVRRLKARVLDAAFARFVDVEWSRGTVRATELRQFIERERDWLDDLSLYVALRDAHGGHGWSTWPADLRDRVPHALEEAKRVHERALLRHAYGQWIALGQWDAARAEVNRLGVEIMGDLPFIVGSESADVWSHPLEFRRDVSLGAPPDGFSADGQDWGLPAYEWEVMDRTDLAWLRARARHAARLYDRFRLDHVVGYFRQYVRHPGQRGWFMPDNEHAQEARGERVLSAILHAAGDTLVIAEDLGVIPPFVRAVLAKLHLPGYRVLPWERDEHHRLRHPSEFPELSVATWSTHDTAPITQWWDEMQPYEREDFARMMGVAEGTPEDERIRTKLRHLYGASSQLTLVLAQELLAERTRINVPATVGGHNWTYRLPAPLEGLTASESVHARMASARELVREAGRFEG